MVEALKEKNPFEDVQLDSVLPGVNARLSANTQKLEENTAKLEEQSETLERLENKIDDVRDGMPNLASWFQGVCQYAANTIPTGSDPRQFSQFIPPPVEQLRAASVAASPAPANSGTMMSYRPLSQWSHVREIYEEWYGVGQFQDKPIVGGLKAFVKKYPEWKNQFKPKLDTRLSRQMNVAKAIEKEKNNGEDLDKTLDDWNAIFEGEDGQKNSLYRLYTTLQANGKVPKGANRGKM